MLSNGVDAANTPDRTAALTTLLDSLAVTLFQRLARARGVRRPWSGASRDRPARAAGAALWSAADVADFHFSDSRAMELWPIGANDDEAAAAAAV